MRQAFVRLSLRGRQFHLNPTLNGTAKYAESYPLMPARDPLYGPTKRFIETWIAEMRAAGGAANVADWGVILPEAAAKAGVKATWLAATAASPARAWLTFTDAE